MKILRIFDVLLYLIAAIFLILYMIFELDVYFMYATIFSGIASIFLIVLSIIQINRGKTKKK